MNKSFSSFILAVIIFAFVQAVMQFFLKKDIDKSKDNKKVVIKKKDK